MGNSRKAIWLSQKKKEYGPIATGLIKEAEAKGIDVVFPYSDLKGYDYILVFENRNFPKLKTEAKIGWWMCDLRKPKELPKFKGNPDVIFLCNTEYMEAYQKAYGVPVYYMPQTGFPWKVEPGRHILWDVSFIGNFNNKWHHNRQEIIDQIDAKYQIHIIGGQRYTKDSPWIYRESPFNLSVSLPICGYTSNRTYNILSSGGFCLTAYFPEIERLFENGKHLAWFKTPEEAVGELFIALQKTAK